MEERNETQAEVLGEQDGIFKADGVELRLDFSKKKEQKEKIYDDDDDDVEQCEQFFIGKWSTSKPQFIYIKEFRLLEARHIDLVVSGTGCVAAFMLSSHSNLLPLKALEASERCSKGGNKV